MNIAFCGLGLMGAPMVRRLLNAGERVAVWNRNPARTAPLVALGAKLAASPRAAAESAGAVMLCLTDESAVEAVVFGPDGVAAGRPRWIVDHSSISPSATRRFSARLAETSGGLWIDAPVSGGVAGAETGRLTCMAGGAEAALRDAERFLISYCARIVRMGEVGAGQTAKLCNQAIVAGTLQLVAEALDLAAASGLDPMRLPEALAGGWADSILLQTFTSPMLKAPEAPVATLATFAKDLRNIRAAADAAGAAMPLVRKVEQVFGQGMEAGCGGHDVSVIYRLLRA